VTKQQSLAKKATTVKTHRMVTMKMQTREQTRMMPMAIKKTTMTLSMNSMCQTREMKTTMMIKTLELKRIMEIMDQPMEIQFQWILTTRMGRTRKQMKTRTMGAAMQTMK